MDMTEKETLILRNERVSQLLISLSQKIGIVRKIEQKYGIDGLNTVKEAVHEDIVNWIDSVKAEQKIKGINNDIQGLHSFLWETNRDEKMEFDYTDEEDRRTYRITTCPIADWAIENNVTDYSKIFFCDIYELIVRRYNHNMKIEIRKCKMDKDKICEIIYYNLNP